MAAENMKFEPRSKPVRLAKAKIGCGKKMCIRDSSISIHTLTARTALLREVGLNVLEKTFYEDYEYISKATLFARSIEFVAVSYTHLGTVRHTHVSRTL